MDLKELIKKGAEVGDNLLLKVSRNGLEAVIVSRDPKVPINVGALDWDALRDEIKEEGVVYGLLSRPRVRTAGGCLVAMGLEAVPGVNARVKYYVKPTVIRAPKVAQNNNKVDYRELGAIVNVPKDKLLLEKIPPTKGTVGKTVCGEEINTKPGKDITIKVGPGVRLSSDGRQAFAELEGKYMLADGKASVMTEHTVQGDIDLSQGNIAFVGQRLNINGAVQPGFKIKCKGDIFIAKGVQNSAVITAGGSLEIKGGVVGEAVVIKSWGDVSIDFVEGVNTIEVKGNLTVTDSIIQGRARVGGDFRVLGGKGVLIGGHYTVGGSVYVRELGSDGEVVTELNVGINPCLAEKQEKLERDKEIWPEKMTEILKAVSALKEMQLDEKGNLIPEKVELLRQYNAMLPEAMEKVNQITERENELALEMDKAAAEAVYAYGVLYPGTKVTIAGVTRIINTMEEGTVVYFNKDKQQIHCRAMTPEEKAAI
ncbi:DUF342 domain-containing protein [Desulfobacterota bacterium M19]